MTVDAPPVGEPEGSVHPYPVAYPAVNTMPGWLGDKAEGQALKNLLWVFNHALSHIELTRTVLQVYNDTADWDVSGPDTLT